MELIKNNTQAVNFINLLNKLPDEDYLLSLIAYGTAPTIREEKPSSLMTFTRAGRNLYDLWDNLGSRVCKRLSLEYIALRDTKDSVRVLFYKTRLLEECLNKRSNREFLNKMGYSSTITLEECMDKLRERFECVCPHEIGIFLGIPLEDVIGFINHKGENCLLCKYWKVYHAPERALTLFSIFDKSRQDIRDAIINNSFDCTVSA